MNHQPCLAPDGDFAAPAFDVLGGACNTHAHIIGDGVTNPFDKSRSYTPPASEDDYFSMLKACSMSRGVLIQVSVHGTDNRYMPESPARHPDTLRGVTVADSTISDVDLYAMLDAGVRGVRFNVLFGGVTGFDEFEHICERIKPLGWHAQFLMDVRRLPEIFPRLQQLKIPCVIDHRGICRSLKEWIILDLRRCIGDSGSMVGGPNFPEQPASANSSTTSIMSHRGLRL